MFQDYGLCRLVGSPEELPYSACTHSLPHYSPPAPASEKPGATQSCKRMSISVGGRFHTGDIPAQFHGLSRSSLSRGHTRFRCLCSVMWPTESRLLTESRWTRADFLLSKSRLFLAIFANMDVGYDVPPRGGLASAPATNVTRARLG